jgi:hypothetical protein
MKSLLSTLLDDQLEKDFIQALKDEFNKREYLNKEVLEANSEIIDQIFLDGFGNSYRLKEENETIKQGFFTTKGTLL